MTEIDFDFSDTSFTADPYPRLSAIREETAVFYAKKHKEEERGLWFLTRYEDVLAAQRDRRLGRVPQPLLSPQEVGVPPERADWAPYYAIEQSSLLMLEPPDHTRLRRLISREFTPKRIRYGLRAIEGGDLLDGLRSICIYVQRENLKRKSGAV